MAGGGPASPQDQVVGFFQQRACADAIFSVACKTTDLTLFVGSGASLPSNLPGWTDFARRVTDELARSTTSASVHDPDDPDEDESGTSAGDLLEAMEIARTAWPHQQFVAAMGKALYGRPPTIPERATSHEAIAELAAAWLHSDPRSKVTILTTNYDLLIERALHRLPPSVATPEEITGSTEILREGRSKPKRKWEYSLGCKHGGVVATPANHKDWLKKPTKPLDQVRVRVVHLHGVLTPDESNGHIIATAADYYRDSPTHEVARKLVRKALAETTCIFLGTSLNDPLVLGHLHNAGPSRANEKDPFKTMDDEGSEMDLPVVPHWKVPRLPLAAVLFSRESFPWAVDPEIDDRTRLERESDYAAMWKALRLSVMWSDFYSQPYQFLREVAVVRQALQKDGWYERKSTRKRMPRAEKMDTARKASREVSYGKRVDCWAKMFLGDLELPDRIKAAAARIDPIDPSGNKALDQQRIIRAYLKRYRDKGLSHLKRLQDRSVIHDDWKLDLWIRDPARRALVRVASTQYEFLHAPTEAVPYPIEWSSELPPIRAFVNGQMDEDDGVGRWQYYLAMPIRQTPEVPSLSLDEQRASREVWGDFPVGALVLGSTKERDEGLLYRREEAKRREVMTLLQVAGNEVVSFSAEDLANHS